MMGRKRVVGLSHALRVAWMLPAFLLLAACIDSAQPLLTDPKPMFGPQARFQFHSLSNDQGNPTGTFTFRWSGTRYEPVGAGPDKVYAFAAEAFEGRDILVQGGPEKRKGARQGVFDYAVARKLADGTYLVIAIDEDHADEAARGKFCGKTAAGPCRIDTREALLAFARATAAKTHERGLLAIRLPEDKK